MLQKDFVPITMEYRSTSLTRILSGAASVLVLILMLTHPSLSLSGAKRGLLLWSQTVLPTLLPFMIASNILVFAGGLPLLMAPLRPLLSKVFALSDDGGYVLLSGLLCGYPMGAKTCAEFLAQGRITQAQARYLLAISNHPSPMFLLGYLASSLSPTVPIGLIMVCLYVPILPLAALAGLIYRPRMTRPGQSCRQVPSQTTAAGSFDAVMMRSVEIMVRIGVYLMLFSILAAFIEKIPALPPASRAVFLGTVEITTGIRAISETLGGYRQGFWMTAAVAFGGLSGMMQTRSVILQDVSPNQRGITKENAGLSIRHYVLWKLLHTITACLLYSFLQGLPHFRLP